MSDAVRLALRPASPVALQLDPEALRPLVTAVVEEVLARLDMVKATLPADRLAYSEAEAARLIGLATHQLRDERHRRRIAASAVVGKRIRYLREDLIGYLMRERVEATNEAR